MSDVTDTAKIILAEVASAKQFAQSKQIGEIFLSAETINSGLAYLLGPMLDAEQAYRIKRLGYVNDGMSAAAAEAHAKATDEYKNWRERAELIGFFAEEINKERKGTKYRPVTYRYIGVKLSHLKSLSDLYYLKSQALDYQARHGSFSKYFFGALKVRRNDA